MERSFKRSIICIILLILLAGFAGKFYTDSKIAQAFASRVGYRRQSQGTMIVMRKPEAPLARKCNVFNLSSIPDDYYETRLTFDRGSAVCYVYGQKDLISRSIINSGMWERGNVNLMERAVRADPSMGLIDIGCNLGCFTIMAAMHKRKVVAVDANVQNIRRLRKSLLKNKIQDWVHLLYNGISDRYSEFSLSSPDVGNIGHSLLTAAKKSDPNRVKSVLMDDLLEVIDFKKAFMKIDIEGHEYEAFHHADKLFTKVNIQSVLMEWHWIGVSANSEVPKFILSFFRRFNYLPYPPNGNTPLNAIDYRRWPWDVIWKKQAK